MALKTLRTRIAQKYDTVANWSTSTLVLLKGELAFDETNRFKVGNGVDVWNNLEYCGGSQTKVYNQLPETDGIDAGTLALSDGKLYYLNETVVENEPVKEWVELPTSAGIEKIIDEQLTPLDNIINGIPATTESPATPGLVDKVANLETEVADIQNDNSDLLTAIQAIEADVATNTANITTINDKIGAVPNNTNLQTEFELAKETADAAKDKASKLETELFEKDSEANQRTIKPSVLPSFVDDVIEGFVVTDTDNQNLAELTHGENDSVTGFFTLISENNQLSLRTEAVETKYGLITARTDISTITEPKVTHNGTEYELWNGDKTKFYKPVSDAIYVDIFTNNTYRWGGTRFVLIASDLAIGTTAGTAFEGDRGLQLENDVAELTTQLNEKTQQLNADIQAESADRIEADAVLASEIARVETKLDTHISTVNADIADIKGVNANQSVAINNNTNDITDLKAKDTDLEGQIAALAATIQNNTQAESQEIQELSDKIGNVPEGKTVQEQIDELANKPDLEPRVVALEQANVITTQNITNINERVDDIEDGVEVLTTAVAAIPNEIDLSKVITNTPVKTSSNEANELDLNDIELRIICGGAE